jgi:DNA-binding CsgD family transcriptional regulator
MEQRGVQGLGEEARVGRSDDLEHGRASYHRRQWKEAYAALSRADGEGLLAAADLELLATSAYMLGRDDDYLSVLERAHHRHAETGETLRAVRCAFWVGMTLALRGEVGPGSGWLSRAQRMLGDEDSVERGYLLMPLVFQREAAGEFEAAAATAADAARIAERFDDSDALALALQTQGLMLIKAGRVDDGLARLDEAMVTIAGGQASPIATGIVYCGVILACQEVHELRRAQEWTAALSRWCEEQPDLVAFTGRCLVHRAEIMQLHGDWSDALAEARRAAERLAPGANRAATAQAFYRQGELLRLQGRFADAEAAYREASRFGWEPQPGMALLRLAQEDSASAAASIRRALGECTQPLRRANLLPAYVEIVLTAGDVEGARSACDELEEIAAGYESAMLEALVAHARGATQLAAGDARAALASLRAAVGTWQELGVPYDAARARVLLAEACRLLGDDDTAALELDVARDALTELGAAPDVARLDAGREPRGGGTYGLTPRQLEVLRLVAVGRSNREIAAALVISEHTVARHLQNIFAALGVSSRSAAGAFAFEHRLV